MRRAPWAKEYPDTSLFMLTVSSREITSPPSTSKPMKGAFLAGILAADTTKSNIVAIVPGMDIPPVEAFAPDSKRAFSTWDSGLNKDIQVLSTTIGAFNDPV